MLEKLKQGADLAVLGFNTETPKNYGRLIMGTDNIISEIVEEKETKRIIHTFESKYSKIISLEETLHAKNILSYTRQATGEKYLIKPNS